MITRRAFVKATSAAVGIAATSGVVGCSREEARKETTTMGMKFSELIEARRSVRKYAKAEISRDEMAKIVEEALNAPSWKNTETTRYYAAIGEEAKAKMWKDALPSFNAASSANAAALVAVCIPMRLLRVMQGSGRVVTALLVYLASGLHSPWWGVMTVAGAVAIHYGKTLRLAEVRTVFALAALPFFTVMGFNLAEKLGGWFDLRVSTPVYALSLVVSFISVRAYEKR